MITCKYDIQRESRWEECGLPAVELKITGPTGDGLDYELCPEHFEALIAAGLIENIRTLAAGPNKASPKVSGGVIIREESYGGHTLTGPSNDPLMR